MGQVQEAEAAIIKVIKNVDAELNQFIHDEKDTIAKQ